MAALNRVRILRFIVGHPRASGVAAGNACGVSHVTAVAHLRALEAQGLVAITRRARRWRVRATWNGLAVAARPEALQRVWATPPASRARILEAVRTHPGIGMRELERHLALSRSAIEWNLSSMPEIMRVRASNPRRTALLQAGQRLPRRVPRELAALLAKIKATPGYRRRIVQEAIAAGETKSTTYHRLRRLVAMGLVRRSRAGIYAAATA